jgi:hypothetical protein
MDKVKLNYIVDALMAVSFTVATMAGLILFFFLPSGLKQGGSQEVLGIAKQGWIQVHNWSGIILIVFVLTHLTLHWRWIALLTKNIFKKNKL